MKIAVCIKQVPVVSQLKFDNETRTLIREGVPNEVNIYDVIGTSAAVGLKEQTGAEVVVFTMGPPQAREALVQCLAIGADRAVHLIDRAFAGSDTLATSRALALALQRESPDLTICGRNSTDAETGQVGPEVAELMGLPLVSGVNDILLSRDGGSLILKRMTDEGFQVVRCPLPALITVAEGVAPEIYPRKEALAAATEKPIVELKATDLSPDDSLFGQKGSPTTVHQIYSIEPQREQIVVRDETPEAASEKLLRYLDDRGILDQARSRDKEGSPRGPRREGSIGRDVWVVAELFQGRIRPVTLELLGKATELSSQVGGSVSVVLMGYRLEEQYEALTAYGADSIYVAEAEGLAQFDALVYTDILEEAIREHQPYALLVPSTTNGRDLASRLAARLQIGLTGDCVGLEIDDEGRLVQLKPAFGGNIVAPILSSTRPQMATIRPGMLTALAPDCSVKPEVRPLKEVDLGRIPPEVLEDVADDSALGAELENAPVIVTVGMGVGGPENIPVVRALADALGGALGATRNVTDAGWLPKQYQVGLTGKSVAPDLYVAVGVSGAFNHTVGIQKAGTVVAVNKNPRAPIFRAADFGIVGDYAEVVPALVSSLQKRSAKAAG